MDTQAPNKLRKKMFLRVYQASNGTVELLTQVEHQKEAIDWARLSTSEIAKELNDESIKAVIMNVQDAMNKLAVQPDWKPHTLGTRIQQLKELITMVRHNKRRQVTLSYGTENIKEEKKKPTKNNQKWNEKIKILQERKDEEKINVEVREKKIPT